MVQNWFFKELDFKGAYSIRPFYVMDNRGGLIKDYNLDVFRENGIDYELKETFYTFSKRGVIRSTHFQLVRPQPKLMRCISGKVYYVMVDLRPESETYGQWRDYVLSGEDFTSILVPAGFGQGYLVLEDAVMSYKAAEVYYGPGDSGIMYNDPDIDIKWPYELIGGEENLIISDKDLNLMSFMEYDLLQNDGTVNCNNKLNKI
ncbi:MAG: dTDP-4-dehydrorhamnose 3,5-epimerase [Selenomonadaceae bacterium]|nr:dTDP-4-dehydrorhamnose 3,5-epimerase [Selenomonadaceae bacterium]